jgi:hypothetical protein
MHLFLRYDLRSCYYKIDVNRCLNVRLYAFLTWVSDEGVQPSLIAWCFMLSMFGELSRLPIENDVACISVLVCTRRRIETCFLGLPERSLITVPTKQSRIIYTCFQMPTQFLEILIAMSGNIFQTICGKINKNICDVSGFGRAVFDVFAHLGSVTNKCGICITSTFWPLEFWSGCQIYKICIPGLDWYFEILYLFLSYLKSLSVTRYNDGIFGE